MYIVVNTSIKMSKGKVGAQCAHVTSSLVRIMERFKTTPAYYSEWIKHGEPKIILRATEEELLLLLSAYSHDDSYWCIPIRDAGRTQVEAGSLTVVGFRPLLKTKVPTDLSNLKLL